MLQSNTPCALIFQNSKLSHKAIPGNDFDRPVIELTIVKNLFFNNNCKIGDINSTLPIFIF